MQHSLRHTSQRPRQSERPRFWAQPSSDVDTNATPRPIFSLFSDRTSISCFKLNWCNKGRILPEHILLGLESLESQSISSLFPASFGYGSNRASIEKKGLFQPN